MRPPLSLTPWSYHKIIILFHGERMKIQSLSKYKVYRIYGWLQSPCSALDPQVPRTIIKSAHKHPKRVQHGGGEPPRPGSQAPPNSSFCSTIERLPSGKLLALIDPPVLTGVIMGLNEQLHSKCPLQGLEYSGCLLKAFPIPGYVKAFSYPLPLQPVHWKFPFLCSRHILSILK